MIYNDDVIDKIKRYVESKIGKPMEPFDICKLFCRYYKSNTNKYDEYELNNRIITHSSRLIDHMKKLIQYIYNYGKNVYDIKDIEILYTSICLHDIGKVHSKTNHPMYSGIISKYLIDNKYVDFKYIEPTNDDINLILEAITLHGDKKNMDGVSNITKILRDVDTLDEICGEPLVQLALTNQKSKNRKKEIKDMNLNKIDYSISDAVMEFYTGEKCMRKVISKLNDPISEIYYRDQIKYAKDLYTKTTANTRVDYMISMKELVNEIEDSNWFKQYLEIIID